MRARPKFAVSTRKDPQPQRAPPHYSHTLCAQAVTRTLSACARSISHAQHPQVPQAQAHPQRVRAPPLTGTPGPHRTQHDNDKKACAQAVTLTLSACARSISKNLSARFMMPSEAALYTLRLSFSTQEQEV